MPKTLILYAPAAAGEAAAFADGARSVRFSEVDLRPLDVGELPDLDAVRAADALALGGPLADLAPLLDHLATAGGALTDRVASAFGGDDASRWAVLARLGGLGLLLVPPGEPAALGKRVATVAEWVRHAKSHHH